MATDQYSELVKLDDVGETIADKSEDIRGRTVIDKDGAKLGKVDALFIDEKEQKIRFLQVETGGFLGIGEHKSVIPIDAIASISEHEVRIDQTGSAVATAPAYDPALVEQRPFYEDTYGYYGYVPFWGLGYMYPALPSR